MNPGFHLSHKNQHKINRVGHKDTNPVVWSGKIHTFTPNHTKYHNMVAHAFLIERVLDRVRKMDFRIDGDPNENVHLQILEFRIYDIEVQVELLFKYSTTSDVVFRGDYFRPMETEVRTRVENLLEGYVHFPGMDYRPDDLIESIETELSEAVADALEKHGRNSKTII